MLTASVNKMCRCSCTYDRVTNATKGRASFAPYLNTHVGEDVLHGFVGPEVIVESQVSIGVHGIQAAVLKRVSRHFIGQPDASPLLPPQTIWQKMERKQHECLKSFQYTTVEGGLAHRVQAKRKQEVGLKKRSSTK